MIPLSSSWITISEGDELRIVFICIFLGLAFRPVMVSIVSVLPTLFPVENIRLINEVYTEDIFWNGYEEKGAVDNLKAMVNDYLNFLNVWK